MQPSVYLAGPIAGLGYGDATDWREHATLWLERRGIKGLSPMRAKEYLKDVQTFSGTCGPESIMGPLSGARAVMTRDRFDATRCDVMLVNLLGATRVSIGTVMECAWADLVRTPVVMISEPGDLHDHAMLNETVGFRATTLSEGLEIVRAVLG
jgi:nucleoside 2-deoxyribosyltransferase